MHKNFIVFLMIIAPLWTNAQQVMIHEFVETYPKIESHVKLVDFVTGDETASYGPVMSRMWEPKLLHFPEIDDVLLVTHQRGKKIHIHVLNKQTLKLKKILKLERFTSDVGGAYVDGFIELVNDGKELALLLGKPSKKALVLFETENYDEVVRFPIKHKKSAAKLSKNRRYVYFKNTNKFSLKAEMVVIDLRHKRLLPRIILERGIPEVTDFNDWLLVTSKISLSEKDTTKYAELSIFNLADNAKLLEQRLVSNRNQQFVESRDGGGLLVINRSYKPSGQIGFYELTAAGLMKIKNLDVDVKLNHVLPHPESDQLLLSGDGNMALINWSDFSVQSARKLPFNAELGVMNTSGDKVFFTTNSGTKMVLYDVVDNRIVNELGIGSVSKRLGKAVANTVLMAAAYHFGGTLVFMTSASGSKLMFSDDESKLLVHSIRTQDVTVFDTDQLKDKYTIKDSKPVILLNKPLNDDAPIIIGTDIRTSLINRKNGSIIKKIKYDQFLGYDPIGHHLFIKKKNKVHLFSTITGESLGVLKSKDAQQVLVLSS